MDFRQDFIAFALEQNVLRFGEFKTKAGRLSPYFFNAGLFNDGAALDRLSQFYAQAILASGLDIDLLYGPAYKGIPLVSAPAPATTCPSPSTARKPRTTAKAARSSARHLPDGC